MESKIMEKQEDMNINHWMITARTSGTTAETLWEDAKMYFMWCEANPIYKQEMIKQTGAIVNIYTPRPFNLPALCIHCGVTPSYINDMARNKHAGDYHLVAQKILQVIYSQNLEYAMVGIFNANVTIRKLGLGDESDKGNTSATIQINVVKPEGTPLLADNEFQNEE
jgi:hypothetical protein